MGRDIRDLNEQLHHRLSLWRARPDAAGDSGFGLRVERAVAHRVVGADFPVEQLGIKRGRLLGLLRDDLKLSDSISRACHLSYLLRVVARLVMGKRLISSW